MNYITENEIDQIAGATGEALRNEPKVRMIIMPGSAKEKFWEGGINGYFFRIKTDTEVELPLSLYKLIQSSRRVQNLSEEMSSAYKRGAGKKVG